MPPAKTTLSETIKRDFLKTYAEEKTFIQEALPEALLNHLGTNFEYQSSYSRFDLADLFFYVDENSKIVKLPNDPHSPVKTTTLSDMLNKGQTLLVPTFNDDGSLNFSKPLVLTSFNDDGIPRLLVMTALEARNAEKSLPELPEEPSFWDKVADLFYRMVGSRHPVCNKWEETNKARDSIITTLRCITLRAVTLDDVDLTDTPIPERDPEQALARTLADTTAMDAELNALQEKEMQQQEQYQKFMDLQKTRYNERLEELKQQQKQYQEFIDTQEARYSKRLDAFKEQLQKMTETGNLSIHDQVVNNNTPMSMELVINRALNLTAQSFLSAAKNAQNTNAFLLQHQHSFLMLAKNISNYIKDNIDVRDFELAKYYSSHQALKDNPYFRVEVDVTAFSRLDKFAKDAINHGGIIMMDHPKLYYRDDFMTSSAILEDATNSLNAQGNTTKNTFGNNPTNGPQNDFPPSGPQNDFPSSPVITSF